MTKSVTPNKDNSILQVYNYIKYVKYLYLCIMAHLRSIKQLQLLPSTSTYCFTLDSTQDTGYTCAQFDICSCACTRLNITRPADDHDYQSSAAQSIIHTADCDHHNHDHHRSRIQTVLSASKAMVSLQIPAVKIAININRLHLRQVSVCG